MQTWWRGAVIYQIYPRSFADSNDDGIGDLRGIIDRLDYVADLGVDAIWLSPFFTSPMRDFGYDVSDFRDVDPIFGSLADFDVLVQTAHELGLKVIIDQVYSHTSDEHPWFQESRKSKDNAKADWYVWADPKPDGTPPSNWQSIFKGPAWTWDGRRKQYYLHNFLSEQPDLNLHNPEVRKAILDTARFWLDRGVDGFRLDATNFYMHDPELRDNPPLIGEKGTRPYEYQERLFNRSQPENFAFIKTLRSVIDSYPDRFAVAEIGDHSSLEELIDYVNGPDRVHTAYSFVFIESDSLSAAKVRDALNAWSEIEATAWPSWAFSNHDAPRVASRWAPSDNDEKNPRFAIMLNSLLCCLRGTVFLYQGQELGLPQAHVPYDKLQDPEAIANWPDTLGRDGARTPMPWTKNAPYGGFSRACPWLPVDPAHLPLSVEYQQGSKDSILRQTKAFLHARKQHDALINGHLEFQDTDEPILAFERSTESERLLCAFNLSANAQKWHPQTNMVWQALDLPGMDYRLENGHVELPAFGACILKCA